MIVKPYSPVSVSQAMLRCQPVPLSAFLIVFAAASCTSSDLPTQEPTTDASTASETSTEPDAQADAVAEPIQCDPPNAADASAWCDHEIARKVQLDEDFAPSESQAITTGLQSWVDATAGHLQIDFLVPGEHDLIKQGTQPQATTIVHLDSQHDAELVAQIDAAANGGSPVLSQVKGYSDGNRIYVVVDRVESTQMLQVIVMHEFGHSLGLPHADDPAALMYPRWASMDPCLKQQPRVTQVDSDALAALMCK